MNEKGFAEIELAIFLFVLSCCLASFVKIDSHLKIVEKRDLHEFERKWNEFTPSNVQRVYQEKK